MKTRTILITVAIVLTGSLTLVSAQNTIEKKSPVVETQQARFGNLANNQVNLLYLNTFDNSKTKLVVVVEEKYGDLVYSKRFSKTKNLNLNLDISDFPEGDYTFKLYNKTQLVCSKVITKQNCISTLNDNVRHRITELSPFIKTQQAHIGDNINNQVNLQYIDTTDKGRRNMAVHIIKESGQLQYSKSFFTNGDLNVSFDISILPVGNYTFQFYNKNELVCTKAITKQLVKRTEKLTASLFTKEN